MEKWKPIKGYEGLYEVSDHGRVRSLDAMLPCGNYLRPRRGRILRIQKSSNGYQQVVLSKEGMYKQYRVHRLVAEAFISNPHDLPEVNHIDEDKTNNHVENLEWCTHQYNSSFGSKPKRGETNPMAKLTADQVADIRSRRLSGEILKTIADDYGISINHVCNIANGKRWGCDVSNH